MTPDLLGQIAQLVEQRIENPRVDSSILSLATIFCLKLPLGPEFTHVFSNMAN